ncbi:hypothetical protein F1D05_36355 [Kribbella qitaiheensis]|uniref:UDP-N-acetylglucosamine kinase n=1 Tax=Kribbella qitaiheensis TaxID=1544730 RepID=A0A7G6X808_9ACTN|nr:zeta toxin family protein [Kribbella qitaiheensis]QNE22373.1 hypothetical protein F1D05_36355 [Kribbella qitaiheensis]
MTADAVLTPAEAEAVVARRLAQITPRQLPARAVGERPILVLIGGQPAAGKSTVQGLVQVALDADRIASYDRDDDPAAHPRYDAIMRANGVQGNDLVAGGLPADLRDRCLDELRSQRYDVIASSPLQSEATAGYWVDGFGPAGYRIAVVYIATNEANSLLGMADRYQRAKDTVGVGRWLEPVLHDRAYAGMPDAAHALETQGRVDDIYVVDRDGNVLYENHRVDGGVMQPPHGARDMIVAERNRPPTPAEHQRFLATALPLVRRGHELEPVVYDLVQVAMRKQHERPGIQSLTRAVAPGHRLDQRLVDLQRITGSGVAPPRPIPSPGPAQSARGHLGRTSSGESLDR